MLKYLEREGIKDGFNSSHAYSVALDSVYGAYLKAKYPLEYYSVVLNIYQNDTSMTAKIIKELNHFKIEIEPISFGNSRATYSPNHNENKIYKGIASIKYLNSIVAEELYELAQSKQYDRNDWVGLLIDIFKTSINTRQMEILIRLDFFKEFGEKEVLLEIYLAMADKKKADTQLYPQFADQQIIIEKKKKKTGEITQTEKTIKKPLKYDSSHNEKTTEERLKNLREYELAVKENPPPKIELYEQITFEKENLGYAYSTWSNLNSSYCLVTEINKKFTPRISFYQLKTGKEIVAKVSKKKFFTEYDQLLYVGDIVQIVESEYKNAWKKEDNKWVEDDSRQELHINKIKIIRKSKLRNN